MNLPASYEGSVNLSHYADSVGLHILPGRDSVGS